MKNGFAVSWLSVLIIGVAPVGFAGEEAAFTSKAAQVSRAPGSPVGPPEKFYICHKGRTLLVAESAVPAHLAHGDTLGPCAERVVICQHKNFTTTVNANQLPGYLARGDTLGPCPQDTFMCNGLGRTIVVKGADVAQHLANGHTLGLCPGKTMICHNNQTLVVNDSALPQHLGHGDSLGYCLGAQGPVVSSNSVPQPVLPGGR